MAETQKLTCYNHPNRETLLRCNRCDRPICAQCAIQTPTGYRCRECVRGQQKAFETAKTIDLLIALVIAAGISFLGSFVPSFLGFFTIFTAPFAGMIIVEIVKKLTGNRRSRNLLIVTSVATILGSLPFLVIKLLSLVYGLQFGGINLYGLLPIIWQAAYTILVSTSVYYRTSGIFIG
jgi:hypothetical protein